MEEIAYYPDTGLFKGEIKLVMPPEGHPDTVGGIRVDVPSDTSRSLEIFTRTLLPIRTEYVGFFTRNSIDPIQCNVDRELEQPTPETIARAILYHSGIE